MYSVRHQAGIDVTSVVAHQMSAVFYRQCEPMVGSLSRAIIFGSIQVVARIAPSMRFSTLVTTSGCGFDIRAQVAVSQMLSDCCGDGYSVSLQVIKLPLRRAAKTRSPQKTRIRCLTQEDKSDDTFRPAPMVGLSASGRASP